MCIIAAKMPGADWPGIDIINNCCVNNPDGFSIAWNEDGELKTFRTMDRAEFVARYHTLSSTLCPETTGAIIHARWATHGSKKLENCHCWTGGGLAFAHNGVLHNVPNRDDMTDSETFFRDYFLPVYEKNGWETASRVAKAIAGPSRFAWIDTTGHIYLLGDWVKYQEQGRKGKLYFSNTGFKAQRDLFSFTGSSFGRTQEVRPRASYGEMGARKTVGEQFNRYGSLAINHK